MKTIQSLAFISILSSSFICAEEEKKRMEYHINYTEDKARLCFGNTINDKEFKEFYELCKKEMPHFDLIDTPNKYYCFSKSRETLLIYSENNKERSNGLFDIFKREISDSFKKKAIPIITTLKVWSKKHMLKIPKPIISIILEYNDQKYSWKYKSKRMPVVFMFTLREMFKNSLCSYLYIDKNGYFAANFKNETNNNVMYTDTSGDSSPEFSYITNTSRLIVPKKVHDGDYLRINSEFCSPGQIIIESIEIDNEKNSFVLKATKDDKRYSIDL